MATVTRTVTLASDETLTNTILHSLIGTATVDDIVRGDLDANSAIVTISTTAPGSPKTGELWFDTNPASNQGMLRVYDGAQWAQVAEGFVGYFGQGSGSVAAGAIVKLDSSVSDPSDRRLAVAETSATTDRAVGVALTEMTTSTTTGIVITGAKVMALQKETGTGVTVGDPVVPSATAGEATTNATSDHGQVLGEGVCGIWLETLASGATSGKAMIFGPSLGAAVALHDPVNSLTAGVTVATSDLATWSGSWGTPTYIDLNAAPPNTIARILNIKLMNNDTAGTDVSAHLHIRIDGSSENTTPLGATGIGGMFEADANTENDDQGLFGQVILVGRPGASNDRLEMYVDSTDTSNVHRVRVWEVGVIAGGLVN